MRDRDVLVVGAGFTGLALLDRLRALGYEAAAGYPGFALG